MPKRFLVLFHLKDNLMSKQYSTCPSDLGLSAETEEIEWDDFEERPMGRQFGETQFESDWSGADEEIYIFFASGRIDITIYANTEIEDISIVAKCP